MTAAEPLLRTPLYDLHVSLGAKMVPFANYEMPVNYPGGIIAEHKHCRNAAALFDVSHMGQLRLVGDGAAAALETLVPMDIVDLGVHKQRYALFTNAAGGILDDLMVTRGTHDLLLVVNAACKAADLRHLLTHIGHRCQVVPMPDRALLALQGPGAVRALAKLDARVAELVFMTGGAFDLAGAGCYVTRSGYTGEDGFEISVPAEAAPRAWRVWSSGGRPPPRRHSPRPCSPTPACSRPVSAHATRCVWRRACASMATTSTTRRRRSRRV
jgi:aminomethyltransferase